MSNNKRRTRSAHRKILRRSFQRRHFRCVCPLKEYLVCPVCPKRMIWRKSAVKFRHTGGFVLRGLRHSRRPLISVLAGVRFAAHNLRLRSTEHCLLSLYSAPPLSAQKRRKTNLSHKTVPEVRVGKKELRVLYHTAPTPLTRYQYSSVNVISGSPGTSVIYSVETDATVVDSTHPVVIHGLVTSIMLALLSA